MRTDRHDEGRIIATDPRQNIQIQSDEKIARQFDAEDIDNIDRKLTQKHSQN